jgi:dTMP kinase
MIEPDHTKYKKLVSQGLFVSFEGIDGCGKSVQAAALLHALTNLDYAVTLVRDPGGPVISEAIRGILLNKEHQEMDSYTELFLYEAARAQLVSEWIRPRLVNGEIVISDRFTDSTIVYQGYGRRLPLDIIKRANAIACGETVPDRTYLLDIPWDESLRRRVSNSHKADRMEKEIESFYQNIRKGYQAIATAEPHRIHLLDGTKTIQLLEQDILNDVKIILKQKTQGAHPNQREVKES